ncbi:hypothetical protein D9611_006000 [Ephemerocybe angulata]|uniref:F-box domain-containing protein n=1 Tax=Ephemerocybe angulata TaxID=980116 RepID=A0A8H5CIB6_9AGAR|nr:hypothetical protein D9611_006000 [Tulosesus angulatus]
MRRPSTAQRHVHAHASSSLYTPSPNPSSSSLPPYPHPISSSTSTSSTSSTSTTTNNNSSNSMPAPPINTIYIPTIPPPTPAPSPGPPSPPFFLDSAPASPPHTPSSTASSLPSPSSPGSGVGAGVSGLGFDLSGVDLASLPPEVLSLLASAPHNPSNPAGSNPNANANGTLYNGSSTTTLPSSSTPPIRRTLLTALLSTCTPAELLFISTLIAPRLKRDFLSTLPAELSLHILSFIDDPKTLGRAGRVCRRWGVLCQEEGVWRGMCGRWGYGVPRAVGRGRGEGKEEGGRDGEGKGGEEGEGGGCGYGERRREEPLEEMEAYANFPMDPALEWLITKRREELAPEGKGKGKGRDVRERDRASACARARYKVFHSPPSSIIDPDAQQDRDYDYGGLTTTGARRRLPHLRLFPTRTPAS